MLLFVLTALAKEYVCKDGESAVSPDGCLGHGGLASPELVEIGAQSSRIADETARSGTALGEIAEHTGRLADEAGRAADEAGREADEAARTRAAVITVGKGITDEMRATREWSLSSQQATLEVQAGLVSPRDFISRTQEIYLENYQPELWAAVLRTRKVIAEAQRRHALIATLVGEGNVDMYESFARQPGACVLNVEDGAWIKSPDGTSIIMLQREGGRSISIEDADRKAYRKERSSDPARERCEPE